ALREVSVYSVYNLVAYSLTLVLSSIQTGLGAGFGQVISKGEKDVLHRSFSTYEFLFFIITFVAYSCVTVLLHPFVTLYSADFDDAALYARWPIVILFALSGFLQTIRVPAVTIVTAAGHYKQTKNRAIIEAVINFTVSVVLVRPLGIVGVVLGAVASSFYRTSDILYNNRHLVKGELRKTLFRIGRNLIISAGLIYAGLKLIPPTMDSWLLWLLSAMAFGISAVLVYTGVNCLFEPKEFKEVLGRFKSMLGK
ncbi:MAG: polysaccharide biosynthesis C-terminal domain-containing protein, partial [Clostridia bacterium]|nr:polysaccharide biosynthesis C-terminal domain-containing protein [Clostridia bacterium]